MDCMAAGQVLLSHTGSDFRKEEGRVSFARLKTESALELSAALYRLMFVYTSIKIER